MAYFRSRFFGSRYFGSQFFGATADAVATDVYAWFPGDRIPTGRRYEEYGEEEEQPRRRKRKPVEVIRDLVPLPPYVVDIPRLEPLPEMVPPPVFGAIPEAPPPVPTPPHPAIAGRQVRQAELYAQAWMRQQSRAQHYQRYAQMAQQRRGR